MNEISLKYQAFIGKKYNCLTILEVYKPVEKNRSRCLCRCDCGNEYKTDFSQVKNKYIKCCGCIGREKARVLMYEIHGRAVDTDYHGKTRSPEYNTWKGVKRRCNDKKHRSYKNYGGRGVKVCDRWKNSFVNFLNDMGEKPMPKRKYSIDRIDNDGNYERANCRWATYSEQNYNRRNLKKKNDSHKASI